MTTGSIWQLQKAIYTRLSTDGTLLGLVNNNVYEHVPQKTDYPFVSIEMGAARDWSTKTTKGSDIIVHVHSFTNDRGSKNCLGVMDRIYVLLHDVNLTVTGYNFVLVRFQEAQIIDRREASVYHGISVFRAKLHE